MTILSFSTIIKLIIFISLNLTPYCAFQRLPFTSHSKPKIISNPISQQYNDKIIEINDKNVHLDKGRQLTLHALKFFLASSLFISLPCHAAVVDSTSVLLNVGDASTYSRYFLAGGICCSLSHAVTVPLDVIKTKKQVSKDMASLSIVEAFKKVIADDGFGMLFKGMAPTLAGYAVQGSMKYGFYELFKRLLPELILSTTGDSWDKLVIYILAGSMAETIGSSFLAPFEACRILLVTNPQFANGLVPCLQKLVSEEGLQSLYKGLPAILGKQLPYTTVQLSTFEIMNQFLTSTVSSVLSTSSLTGNGNIDAYRFGITLVSATTAGILSSLASQPGDALLSAVNKQSRMSLTSGVPVPVAIAAAAAASNADSQESNNAAQSIVKVPAQSTVVPAVPSRSVIDIMRESIIELGPRGLFTGTKARLAHVVTIVVIQLLVYDYIKQLCGISILAGAGGH